MQKRKFKLNSKVRTCEVFSGHNLEEEIIKYIKSFKANKFIIITDSKVEKLHARKFYEKLINEGINAFIVSFLEGEKSKNRETKEMLEDFMFEQKCGRDSCIIAFGGGVTGDLAGFVAATYMRGIPILQIPTTTISVVDSSYGGKTGIDVPAGKNLIGAYHQPEAVFVDVDYLKTLDKRNYISGLIETIKHGLIYDERLYNDFKKNINNIIKIDDKNNEILSDILFRSILVKQKVVEQDETESNLRKILNYGHTIGHAIEKLSDFELLHGEAIAIGICAESYVAYKNKICSLQTFNEQKKFIESIGLSTKIPEYIKTNDIIQLMKLDKKARDSTPEFTLISDIGKYAVFENGNVAKRFNITELETLIEEYRRI